MLHSLRYISLCVLLFSALSTIKAQYPTDGCFIRYQYDNAGNRTQRDWYCVSGAQGGGQKSMPLDTATTSGALAEVHLLLAPNPASDQMRISLSAETGVGLLLIHDGHGREVYRQTMNSPTTTLDVSSFSTGPYYMSFVRDTERIVSGFAIQR